IRLALSLAIDRQQIVDSITQGGEIAASGLVPPGIKGYAYPNHLSLDVQRAQQLLAEAGYPEGKDLPPIEILFNNAPNHCALAEAVAHMWQNHLGVEVK
ncbi:MAG TPA: ABC transporter substrate-binding protein, partial [Opitutales bacterium]|nr:ABC transporter substrate-binding protein [Opitutales bacterium]